MSDTGKPAPTPLERAVRTLAEDTALRPVLIVVVLVLGTFVAGGLLLALRAANLFAMAAIAAMVFLTLLVLDGEIREARRVTLAVWAIASVWVAALAIAALFVSIGAF